MAQKLDAKEKIKFERKRFEEELEFVELLADPKYIKCRPF